ncbi:MAG: GH92 family glycosyl hydrolase [Proteobacteria bacterium]|nr:GH92 family glycosyl hydrolase [Pseudomonadota bacterium]
MAYLLRHAFTVALAVWTLCCGSSSSGTDAGGPPISPDAQAQPDASEPPPGGPVDFFSSFEISDPQPDWTDSIETDPQGMLRAAGVSGQLGGILGTIMDKVSAVAASGENPPGETAAHGADGDPTTKWLVFADTGWIRMTLKTPVAVRRYAVTSANDVPERDPRDWVLEGSDDTATWTQLDARTGESFAERYEMHQYEFANDTAYTHYRLRVTANHNAGILQIADVELSNGDNAPPEQTPMRSFAGTGPGSSFNANLGVGFTGTRAFRLAGSVVTPGRAYSYNKVFDVDLAVMSTTELSYVIMPDAVANDLTYPSTYTAVDLAFDDGTYLSELSAIGDPSAGLSPQRQGASRTLLPGEWNRVVARVGDVAQGKRIKRILVGYDHPNGAPGPIGAWIDDLRITGQPEHTPPAHLADYVITTRGTLSGPGYSRGNTFPATAVPHGFNFWTPVTDAGSLGWLYAYHRTNDANNLPRLQALSLSHEPSPWMGDRQTFQVMPSSAPGTPTADRGARALAFRHDREIARPYYYSVAFENGIRAEIAPTDHAAMFRFTFPGDDASLVFDNVDNRGGLSLDAAQGVVTGYTDVRSGLSAGATRMFVYAELDQPVTASGALSGGGGANVGGYLRFELPAGDRTVTMRIATSLISVDQARKNLALEIAETDSFEDVMERARAQWNAKLSIIEVEGATEDQLVTLYSNLYRLFLYPNSGFENTGTAEAPVYQYASPVSPPVGANTPTQTGARIVSGKLYVNNGFWDTYRTVWPAYALFAPTQAGAMIDGFVQQYKDGGWVSRWSSPGYADLMTGTSSDVAFADAYLKGVPFDATAAYDAAVKNATVAPPNGAVGRKGLSRSIFLGYTTTETGAGLSWAMAGYLNDFGLANMAAALAEDAYDPRRDEYAEMAGYFRERSLGYVHLFDSSVGFFQGRNQDGSFRLSPAAYDPAVWGFDYTETNGWNMAFDAPHDGQGLANLYGGREALAAKLDTFFTTPETAMSPGSYGSIIHEMLEARDVRMGQLGLSNQPAYHIMYMYNYTGQPWKAQEKVRDALARLFRGSDIGQGYLGDEDNGALSSWYIFSALGFYPLQVGSPTYAIGSPLFTKATVHLENGKTLVIEAPNNSARNVYVQGLTVDGEPHSATYLTHDVLADGARLVFDMGREPSTWGTGAADAPPSITQGTAVPRPLADAVALGSATVSATDGTNVVALFDDTTASEVAFASANAAVEIELTGGPVQVAYYTMTSASAGTTPTGWRLLGSSDGITYALLDERSGVAFAELLQTRAFRIDPAKAATYAHYRLELTGAAAPRIGELELLARP